MWGGPVYYPTSIGVHSEGDHFNTRSGYGRAIRDQGDSGVGSRYVLNIPCCGGVFIVPLSPGVLGSGGGASGTMCVV